MVDNSENDSAESIATKPEIMKEMITPGPAYLAAALPLRTKIPAPANQFSSLKIFSQFSLTNSRSESKAG